MRLLIFALALVGCFQSTTFAQLRIGDIPDSFYGAQRGRVVAHPHGGFRLHYGRGLTQQGAGVITTAIGTLGPMLPLILGANTPSSAPNNQPAPANAPSDANCNRADPELDALVENHSEHIANLNKTEETLNKLLKKYGIEPTVVAVEQKQDANNNIFIPDGTLKSGIVNPTKSSNLPAPSAAPRKKP